MKKLTALIKGYRADTESMLRLSCSAISNKTVARTPVDEGDLRASWTPNNGDPIARNVSSGDTRNDIAAVINTLKLGDTYSFANGQPYARRIEYEGHSKNQAPNGMRDISVAEWSSIVSKAVRDAS